MGKLVVTALFLKKGWAINTTIDVTFVAEVYCEISVPHACDYVVELHSPNVTIHRILFDLFLLLKNCQ